MKNLIIASTSSIHGQAYLSYILTELSILFEGVEEILFIPYARPDGISCDEYTNNARMAFDKIGKRITGIHNFENARGAVKKAKGIFVGGGNTFLLVKTLYQNDLFPILKMAVENGTPYLGTSAGSNITGISMHTSNDMPIVLPPSFETLGFINFNINPHYLDSDPNSTFMGESRETRIKEFHTVNSTPVLGLREGSWLQVKGNKVLLKGGLSARLFEQNRVPKEYESGSDLSFLT